MRKRQIVRGSPKNICRMDLPPRCFLLWGVFLPSHRSARDILEEYWTSIGGKPVAGEDSKPVKKRGRQSTEGAKGERATSAKKQRTAKGGRNKSNGDVVQDVDPGPMYGFTDVGEDAWKPPAAKDGNWDPLVQSVDTVVRENSDGELWGYLIWNEKSEEGRFYRSKAKLPVIYKACPQRVSPRYTEEVDQLR